MDGATAYEGVPDIKSSDDPKKQGVNLADKKLALCSLFKIPFTVHQREYPPMGRMDTRRPPKGEKLQMLKTQVLEILELEDPKFDARGMELEFQIVKLITQTFPEFKHLSLVGAHGYGNSYRDKDILRVYPEVSSKEEGALCIKYTANNKPVISQQATRGCTAAASAMLIYENGGRINLEDLFERNLGDDRDLEEDIQRGGLKAKFTMCEQIEDLEALLSQDGSAIVKVNAGMGGHVVVVDAISQEAVRLRDPYHGWEVDIDKAAFEVSWSKKNEVLQVVGR